MLFSGPSGAGLLGGVGQIYIVPGGGAFAARVDVDENYDSIAPMIGWGS